MPVDFLSLTEFLAAGLVLVLPGAALLVWQTGLRRDPLEWLADSVGLSISISALIALGAFLLSVSISGPALTGLYALAGLVLAAGLVFRAASGRVSFRWASLLMGIVGLAALGGLIAWRLVQARGLVLPLWVDSVHHVLVTQKILATGGLPADLNPELPVLFSYHYAFHLVAALFSHLTGGAVETVLLRFGQVLNALVALSIYRLAKAAWGDWRRAALAGLLVGFVSHMPAYYLTWGRYTLLTGLVVLPVAMAAAVDLGRRKPPAGVEPEEGQPTAPVGDLSLVPLIINLAVLTAGVALAHYTALWLLGWFFLLWGMLRLPGDLRARSIKRPVFAAALAALAGVALAGPWLARMLAVLNHMAGVDLVEVASDQTSYLSYLGQLIGPRRNLIFLVLGGGGMVINLFRRETRWLAAWGLLLGLLTLPWGLRFAPFRPDHYAIVLFLPAAPLAADLIVSIADAAGRIASRSAWLRPAIALVLAAAVGGALLAWGLRETSRIINPTTVLTDEADVAALAWVAEHTPAEARFFVNTTHWQGGAYRGVDGGYWLLPLAGRQSIMPPAIAGWGEVEYVRSFTETARRASEVTTCTEAQALTAATDLTHIYVKKGAGSLQPPALDGCPGMVLLYRKGGVYIYAIEAIAGGG